MKRWLVHLFIASYLSALGLGTFCHTFGVGQGMHPAMYYVIWDMFCGWSSYESRMQVIGEGESGKYYELSPAPWGEFKPYGPLGRRHYDSFAAHGTRIGLNAIQQTQHEPITKIIVVEQNHSKKYNLSEEMYERLYGEPKSDFNKYFHVRRVMTPEGRLLSVGPAWQQLQFRMCLAENPRLQADARRGKPFYALESGGPVAGSFSAPSGYSSPSSFSLSAPLGN